MWAICERNSVYIEYKMNGSNKGRTLEYLIIQTIVGHLMNK